MNIKYLDKLNKKEKRLFFVVTGLLVIWVVYGLIIEPFYTNWMRLSKNIEISTIELKRNIKILKQREQVIASYDKYLGSFKATQSDEEEMALILNGIEAQARKSYVRIINMKPRRVEKADLYRFLYVNLDIEATMPNVLKFIKALKDSELTLCVEQITLNSRAREPSVLSGAITISRFAINSDK